MEIAVAYFECPLGLIRLQKSMLGLERLEFFDSIQDNENLPEKLNEEIVQLKEYFEGKRRTFNIPLHLSGSPFQELVWDSLLKIEYSKVISYETLARNLGDIKLIRAAATANGKNPISIIVPCHRVIGKDGSLTGYSGGLWRKQWLLELEQKENQPRLF